VSAVVAWPKTAGRKAKEVAVEFLIFLLVWFFLCCLVANLADSRGRSALGYFFFSIMLSPLLGFAVLLVKSNKKQEEKEEEWRRRSEENRDFDRKREHEKQLESLRALTAMQQRTSPTPVAPNARQVSLADELEKLAALRDRGVLTNDEFESQKKALLGPSAT
jgi:hypothetical protein